MSEKNERLGIVVATTNNNKTVASVEEDVELTTHVSLEVVTYFINNTLNTIVAWRLKAKLFEQRHLYGKLGVGMTAVNRRTTSQTSICILFHGARAIFLSILICFQKSHC